MATCKVKKIVIDVIVPFSHHSLYFKLALHTHITFSHTSHSFLFVNHTHNITKSLPSQSCLSTPIFSQGISMHIHIPIWSHIGQNSFNLQTHNHHHFFNFFFHINALIHPLHIIRESYWKPFFGSHP